MHGNKEKEALKKVLTPLLSKLNPSAWAVLNKNMVWSQKRPVWLQVCYSDMALLVMKFQVQGYKIRKIFAYKSTYPKKIIEF